MNKKTVDTGVVVERISREQFSDEICNSGVIEKYPEFANLDGRDQLVMIGVSLGYSYRFLADAMRTNITAISRVVNRVDPTRRYREDEVAKKVFIAGRARSKAMEMITAITPQKISEASMSTLVKGAKGLMEVAAITERKTNALGDGKVKKVTVEFFDPVAEMETADVEVLGRSGGEDDEEVGLLTGLGFDGERDRTVEEDRIAGTVYEGRGVEGGPDFDPDFDPDFEDDEEEE